MSDGAVGRRCPRSTTTAILRVDKFTTTIPVRFQHLTSVTLYVRGPVAPGDVLGDILRNCQQLQRVRIERRDNDWDAPDTKFVLSHEQEMADALRGHASLQDFCLVGVTTSLNLLCESLVSLPQLNSMTLSADPHYAAKTTKAMSPLLSPNSLSLLLQHLTRILSLTGLFPETQEYTRIFHDAYVRDACTIHIFVHFSGNSQPSAFSFYIRQVMELNQMGRRRLQENADPRNHAKDTLQLLQLVARRHRNTSSHRRGCYSLDTAYLLIRENPWLCCSSPTEIKRTWKQKLHRVVKKILGRNM